ncbi:MAG: ATP-binding cassette domain-containing protein [Alphaproteobacteria bacterium]|nr:ATP-binding cassette domain-containing protein [Alphaproteobacteria bacterium]
MWPFVKPYTFRALLAVLISIPIGALDSVVALSLKPYMDIVLVDKSAQSPTYIPFLIIAFTTLQGGLNYAATYMNTWVGTKINHDLKRHLFKKLLCLETSFFDNHDSGMIIQRFNSDTATACSGLLDNLKTFISRFFSSVSLICVLFYNSWQLAIIAVIVLICALMPLSSVKRRIKKSITQNVQESTKIYTNYNETHNGNKTISSYNMQNYIYEKFNSALIKIFKLSMKVVQKTGWMTPLMHIIVSAGIGGVIWFGSTLIVNGTISAGNFVSFITALILLYTPIKSIGKSFNNVQISFLAIERIVELINRVPTIADCEHPKILEKIKNEIEFKNVVFEYIKDCPVLKNVNLKVKAGSNIAIVGNSGGGKTTLVNLLPRFYEVCKGQILIDGTDIREYSLKSLRDNIAVVFQDNFLFSGTIRDNILFGKPDATEKDINNVLKMVYLDDFVKGLENGLDTEIGERGTLLSGGQKQRLAIARALIKNAPIVILDEATSALDNKSEAVVQKAIENLMKNRTVFVIAHRLSTVKNAEQIIVINDGQIVEQGTHEELLKISNGAYTALYNAQFKTK